MPSDAKKRDAARKKEAAKKRNQKIVITKNGETPNENGTATTNGAPVELTEEGTNFILLLCEYLKKY